MSGVYSCRCLENLYTFLGNTWTMKRSMFQVNQRWSLSLADQVTKITTDFVKAQDCLSVLEKDLKTEKAFCALKDKKLKAALGKIEKARVQVVVDFKKSNKYDDKLCSLYAEGFDLVRTYMKKHHPKIDLSTLDIEEVEREVVAD